MTDLFGFNNNKQAASSSNSKDYTAEDIQVLEGLEPVRMRPGMYIGGTDSNALHHLVAEVLDNAMDEATAGFAKKITVELIDRNTIAISDDGRGIPVDNHPKFPNKSALEVILTTLHSGGKFSNSAYQTAGGLHGVGISVVNALSAKLIVEVYKQGQIYQQEYCQGAPQTPLTTTKGLKSMRGTKITFSPDTSIFDAEAKFDAHKIYNLVKSKAYLYKGVAIHWQAEPSLLKNNVPAEEIIHFPNGLSDYLESQVAADNILGAKIFSNSAVIDEANIRVEWAMCWQQDGNQINSYCNTIPTPMGGTHEQGFRAALNRSIKAYGEMAGHKKATQITIDDIVDSAFILLSVFIPNPVFQGQTKEKLVSKNIAKYVESSVKDHLDHWLSSNTQAADAIIQQLIDNAEYRLSRKAQREVSRKTPVQKLRLPGKLADCTNTSAAGSELFLVEGDSAGGSAKQARDRATQAVLPLRGKILNIANAQAQKIANNQEIKDLEIALNCGHTSFYQEDKLRYERIIIMTDADVDGAHICALLMTFFYLRMPKLIANGHLFLARPPLYRLICQNKTYYAHDEEDKNALLKKLSSNNRKVEVGRFKGLGEMTPSQLKETTMNEKTRTLYKVKLEDVAAIDQLVDDLMGKNPEKRFQFIQNQVNQKIKEDINLYV